MTIRPERPEEFQAIELLIREAFLTAEVSDGDEHRFAARRRADGNYLPGLALVAELGGRIAGHIMLTRFVLRDATAVLLVAPLSVAAEHRRRGIGTALLREGLRRGAKAGYAAALLLGDPDYYGRVGFRPSAGFGIRCADAIPERYVQVLELVPGALSGKNTTFSFDGL